MSLKVRAGLGLATAIIAFAGAVTGLTLRFTQVIERLDTRLGKLESAIRTMNVTTPDERYKQLIKELMAQEKENRSPLTGQPVQRFGGNSYPADAGAAADMPSTKPPQ